MDQELLLIRIPTLYSGVQRHAAARAGARTRAGQGHDQDGEKKNEVNLHAAAAISGSTVM